MDRVVLGDVVGEDDDLRRALGLDLARDRVDGDDAVDRLATGHRDGIVEQDLVGDVGLRRDRLADRKIARVVVGAVAEVLEHVRHLGEHRVRDPVDAFAAHLDQAFGVAVHPRRHEVAADAGLRARALGHLRRGVVRAAGAEVRHALDRVAFVREQLGDGEVAHEVAPVELRKAVGEPARDDFDQARRPQLAELADERLAARVALADHLRPHRAVIEKIAQLLLDQAGLLLDDEDLVEAIGERVEPSRLDRIGEADLVDANAGGGERIERDVEAAEDLEQVEVRLAAGDDTDAGARRDHDVAVDRVDLGEGAHGVELGVQALLDLQRRQVGPAIVQAVGGSDKPSRGGDGSAVLPRGDACVRLVEVDRRAALDDFRQRGEADPVAREARQRPAVQAELEVLGDVGRREHRHVPRLHRRVALVRHRRRDAAVIVAGDDEDAAVRRGAVGVAVLERVAGAVDAGALAVPHREDAFGGSLGIRLDALRAEHSRRGELFVDRGQELDAGRVEPLRGLPRLLVDHAERRAAVAADEPARPDAGRRVARALHESKTDQRLRPGEENGAGAGAEVVGEGVVGADERGWHGTALRDKSERSNLAELGQNRLLSWPHLRRFVEFLSSDTEKQRCTF